MRLAKQVIVMRKDLNMRKGKMIAQGAHAAMKVLLDRRLATPAADGSPGPTADTADPAAEPGTVTISLTPALARWLEGRFTKVCVYVTSEDELVAIHDRAQAAGLLAAMIVDAGITEFNGVATRTCCAIGPDWADDVDAVTGGLPLL